jgi:hypothetical protein
MSDEGQGVSTRREVLKTTGTLVGVAGVGSATASAGKSVQTRESAGHDISTVDSGSEYTTYRVAVRTTEDVENRVQEFLTIVYDDSKRNGQVHYVRAPDADVHGQAATSHVRTNGDIIIDEKKNLGGTLNEPCSQNFCTYDYNHRYGGFTFRLTDLSNTYKNAALTSAVVSLISKFSKFDPRVWVITGAITHIINQAGKEFTMMPIDADGFFGAEIKHFVSSGWAVGPEKMRSSFQYFAWGGHLSKLDIRCGSSRK